VYHAFELYRPHMGARLVPMRIEAPELCVELLSGAGRLPGLSGSASLRGSSLCVTLTNPSLGEAVTTSIRLEGGARVAEARGRVLTHREMTATNSFERPDEVKPAPLPVETRGDAARVTIPAKAIVALELRIA
jgi:alpha-N-arabinofuranosidase